MRTSISSCSGGATHRLEMRSKRCGGFSAAASVGGGGRGGGARRCSISSLLNLVAALATPRTHVLTPLVRVLHRLRHTMLR